MLLDTNMWIAYLAPGDSPVKKRFHEADRHDILLCSVVKAELLFGAWKSGRRDANLIVLQRLFANFASLPFDDHAAAIAGRIRADLAAKGRPIGPYDLQIAAIALARGMTLVTHNVKEFARISGLIIEDWQT
jgi:tRNA(fMet)-specific endonuclease VapC